MRLVAVAGMLSPVDGRPLSLPMFTAKVVRTCCRWAFGCLRQRRMPCPWANSLTVPFTRSGPRSGPASWASAARPGLGSVGLGVRAGEADVPDAWCTGCGPGGAGAALGEPCRDQRRRGGRGGRVGAVRSLADLALGAGQLAAVEVDVEVVPAEALVLAVLTDGVARQLAATPQPGMDAGQSPGVVRGGRGRGHIRDRARVIGGAGQVPLCTAIASHYARRAERVEFTGLVLWQSPRAGACSGNSAAVPTGSPTSSGPSSFFITHQREDGKAHCL